ncbi:DUF2834 domain-containing protein [Psychrobacter sp. I-STPA10]|uniref:DUF2834 domain-containing protein n=1 Tax=Psychrobacter sp. I-STPA10 TaxID=2585769 RepID=UPI001E63DDD3|nr:DUF2834 domain-containing protein [Psychrobacter sp. I-STPA10]
MPKSIIYLLLAVIGAVIPYTIFIFWLMNNGFNISLFFHSIIDNPISLFAWVDVLISAIALIYFIVTDKKPVPPNKRILSIIATLLVGVSCGLPLYLYFRENYTNNVN